MIRVRDVAQFLESHAPCSLAESWDNVGLLVGDAAAAADRVMTCLTITPESAAEAIRERAGLIVTHHPLPFRPSARITSADSTGHLLWQLIGQQISVYSAHTAYDSAERGINQRLAESLDLKEIAPIVARSDGPLGAGRRGQATGVTLNDIAHRLKSFLGIPWVQAVGDRNGKVSHVAVACGSAGEFIDPAVSCGCDCLVTGEARFHAALEAAARGIGLILVGHFASERFALECLADEIRAAIPGIHAWASRDECDPLSWI